MGLSRRAPKNDDDRTIPLSEAAFSILQERRREWEGERSSSVVDLRVFGDAGDIRKVLDRPAVRAAIAYNTDCAIRAPQLFWTQGLLTHSSGLPRGSDYPYWTGPDFPFPTHDEIVARLSQQPTFYNASRYFQYSNLGMSLAGEIVVATSYSLATYMRELVGLFPEAAEPLWKSWMNRNDAVHAPIEHDVLRDWKVRSQRGM